MCHRRWFVLPVVLLLAACGATRPPPPPRDHVPFGAVHLDHGYEARNAALHEELVGHYDANFTDKLVRERDGDLVYPVLSLSGGGSYVAFAAGVLTGWSDYGGRPEFRLVTAMSGGALVAPWAFLGPDYDHVLEEIFTTTDTDDVYQVGWLGFGGALFGDAAFDFAPGRALLARYLTPAVVDAIAAAHRDGRRLYIATANMDDNVTAVWDVGAVAASDRPDRVEYVRRIFEAAVAVPGLFPPVYFPIETATGSFGQMHTDAQIDFVLMREFMIAADAHAAERLELADDLEHHIYAVLSTRATPHFAGPPEPWAPLLGRRAVERIGRYAAYGALDRLYLFALAHNAQLRVAALPVEFDPGMPNYAFDTAGLTRLYRFGYAQAAAGYPWADAPPELPREEIVAAGR